VTVEGSSARRPPRRLALSLLAVAALAAAGLQLTGINAAASQATSLHALRVDRDPGLDPSTQVWDRAREVEEVELPLTAQQTTYPFGGGSIPTIRVRALHYKARLYLRLEWHDGTRDDTTGSVEKFSDAVAVEFPAQPGSSVPSICMGQADGGVNIWQWRADRQRAPVESPRGTHPNGYVDLYPSTNDLYFPARKAVNPYANPRGGPAQDLVAQGFGTIGPAAAQAVTAHGVFEGRYETGRWAVVFARPFGSPGDGQPAFRVKEETDVAFAVWNGSAGDRNGKKSVSQFAKLSISKDKSPSTPWNGWWLVGIAFAVLMLVALWQIIRWSPRGPR